VIRRLANSFVSQSLKRKIRRRDESRSSPLRHPRCALGVVLCGMAVSPRSRSNSAKTFPEPVVTSQEYTAPYSRSVFAFHLLGFAAMYIGIIDAVFAGRVPSWFPGQRAVGTFAITGGAALLVWAVASFPSWRFRAKLDRATLLPAGAYSDLATSHVYRRQSHRPRLRNLGPYRGHVERIFLIVLGSELRARTEESVLRRAFGSSYTEYCKRTKRFVPGVY